MFFDYSGEVAAKNICVQMERLGKKNESSALLMQCLFVSLYSCSLIPEEST